MARVFPGVCSALHTWMRLMGRCAQPHTLSGSNLPQCGMSTPVKYPVLHKYLYERYADTVVLTFRQIEDLLGFALPAAARTDSGWWTAPPGDGAGPDCSDAWRRARRTATPNLVAQHVVFERIA